MAYELFDQVVKDYSPRMQQDLNLLGFHCDGIFGNFGYESLGFTKLQEIKPFVRGSAGGYGWAQWTGPRRNEFFVFAAANGKEPSDPEINYQFFLHEAQGKYKYVIDAVRETRTRDDACRVFMEKYEVPGVPALDTRIKWAIRAETARLEAEGKQTVTDVSGVTPVPPPPAAPAPSNAQLAQSITNIERMVEEVLVRLAKDEGVPAPIVDLVKTLVDKVDLGTLLAGVIQNINWGGLLKQVDIGKIIAQIPITTLLEGLFQVIKKKL